MAVPSNSKVQIFGKSVIVAPTGSVGYAQRLTNHVEMAITGNVFRNFNIYDASANLAQRMLKDLANTQAQKYGQEGLRFGAMVAVAIKDEPYLIEFASTDFQPEIKTGKLFYGSMGSGQVLADPFLAFVTRVLWKDKQPSVDEGRFGVHWVLSHTIRHAAFGVGGPPQIATLKKSGDAWVAEEMTDYQEAGQYIEELETHIGSFVRNAAQEAAAAPIPEPPQPPNAS